MKDSTQKIRVGDRVWIQRFGRRSLATVVEDRGHIGVQGRRLLRITHGKESDGTLATFEIPEEDVTPFRRARRLNGHVAGK